MRLNARTIGARVLVSMRRNRPITLEVAGLSFGLTRREATQLADQLHDAADGDTQ